MDGNVTPWVAMVAGALVSLGATRIALARYRARHGTRVTGTVMTCEVTRTGGGPGRGPSRSWSGLVRFRDPGTGVTHEDRVVFGGWRAPGSGIPLCYPRGCPDRVQEFNHWAVGLLLVPYFVLGLAFLVGGLVELVGGGGG